MAGALALSLLVLALAAAPTRAQMPGSTLEISVLTFGQGDAVFERFGHNALRVRDRTTGSDLAYNWGMFSFDDPNFIGRFLSGDTRYWVEAFPTQALLEMYVLQDRASVEQVLALTPSQRLALATFVEQNVQVANRYYRYDYFLDNCSTRLRGALDHALGGSLRRRFDPMRTEWSYRSESVRLTATDGLAQAGIDIALGPRADVPLTAWEAMFIPMRLRDYLREVTVADSAVGTVPLVSAERVLYTPVAREAELAERRGLSLGAWGPILGAWMLLLAPFGAAARRRTRIPAGIMVLLFYGITGLLGVALLGMWVGSAHVFWYRNLNLLLLPPIGVLSAWPVARAVWRGVATPYTRVLLTAHLVCSAVAVAVMPFATQEVSGPMLLLLPAHIGLAITIRLHLRVAAAAAARPSH